MLEQIPQSNRRWLILANTALGTFMATLDGSIANVALPTIANSFHISLNVVQWVVTAYLLTICALLPVVGKLSDLYGKARLYRYGFLLFSLGSALCSLAQHIGFLIFSRILQAVGASFLMANSQGIVAQTFSERERGRAMGIIGTVVSLGSLTGPSLGGVFIGWFGWPSIFWINIPIGIFGFLAALRVMPREKMQTVKEPFDYWGSLLFMGGMVLLMYTVSKGEVWGWGSSVTLFALGIAAALMIGFYWRERTFAFPMLDLSLYRIRTFAYGTTAGMLSFVSLFCVNIMMPFYVQHVLQQPPEITGFIMAAFPLTMAVVAPLSGYLSDKIGSKLLTVAGQTINALGFVSLNLLGTQVSVWTVALHLAVFGMGQGMFQSPNNSSIMGSVPRRQLGIAGGMNALVRNVGMVLGISLSTSLFTYRLHALTGMISAPFSSDGTAAQFVAALHTVFWAAACVSLLSIVFSVLARTHTP